MAAATHARAASPSSRASTSFSSTAPLARRAGQWRLARTHQWQQHRQQHQQQRRLERERHGACAAERGGSDSSGSNGLSREERDLAENVKGLLQRERVRLDRDVREMNNAAPKASASTQTPPSAPASPFARQASFRASGGTADPFAAAGTAKRMKAQSNKVSVRETVEADEATLQTDEDARVTWIWERIDAEQLVVVASLSIIFLLMCLTFALVFKSGAVHLND